MSSDHEPLTRRQLVRTLLLAIGAIDRGDFEAADMLFVQLLVWLEEDDSMEEKAERAQNVGEHYVRQ